MKRAMPCIMILLSTNLSPTGAVKGAESLQKVRIGLPSAALTYLPF